MDIKYIREQYGEILFNINIELGRKKITIRDMLSWDKGTILTFPKTSGEPVDILVNNKPLALGEVMVLEDKFAVRLTDILSKEKLTEMFKDSLYRY